MRSSERLADVLVVLPTLGQRVETLRETLESIDQQRNDVSLRLIVVVPRDAAEARELLSEFDAVIVDDPGTGMSQAINDGIAARAGEKYYAWMGDDDLFRPHGLQRLVELLEGHPGAPVAYGGCDYIDESGRILGRSRAGNLAQDILAWGPDLIPHPGSMIRIFELEAVGFYAPHLKFAMDLDVFLRLKRRGRFVSTRESVSAFRWHKSSLTVANRNLSSAESERVKQSYYPKGLRAISFIWVFPVRWASNFMARVVSAR